MILLPQNFLWCHVSLITTIRILTLFALYQWLSSLDLNNNEVLEIFHCTAYYESSKTWYKFFYNE